MADSNQRKTRKQRIARIVRPVIVGGCLIWFCRFAYVRSTTLPPGVLRQPAADTSDDEATAELAGAIARLPSFLGATPATVPVTFTGGAGDLSDALRGEWTPQSRPFLTKIIKHITSPKMDSVLDDFVNASGGGWTMSYDFGGAGLAATVTPWNLQEPINALLVRARLMHAERNDAAGALSDLLAALHLCGRPSRQTMFWGQTGQPSAVAVQIRMMAIERDIPLDESAAILEYARTELTDSISAAMLARLRLQGTAGQILDQFYTDDGDGHGWLVLSELGQTYAMPGTGSSDRSPFWNVLSPLFNGRAEIAGKFEQFMNEFVRIDLLAYQAGLDAFQQLQDQRLFNVTDGPFVQLASEMNNWMFEQSVRDVIGRRSIIISLALSAFKHDRGAYPESLDELTPKYLDRIPLDVLTAEPFDYRRSDEGYYVLNEGQTLPMDPIWNPWSTGPSAKQPAVYRRARAAPLNEPASGGGK